MMDHGILNVPLARRGQGSIDQQIDAYKREQARADQEKNREARRQFIDNKTAAKVLLATHLDAIVKAHKRFDAKALRGMLTSWSKWEPHKLIDLCAAMKARGEL